MSRASNEAPEASADRVGQELFQSLGIDRPVAPYLEEILAHLGLIVRAVNSDSFDAALLRKSDRKALVLVRESLPFCTQKHFALAHELGHHQLHPHLSQFLCTTADLAGYKNNAQELEANSFAAGLLMPDSLFSTVVGEHEPDLDSVLDLSSFFGVGPAAAGRRLLARCHHRAMMVFCQEGKTRYYVTGCKGHPSVKVGQPMPDVSMAASCQEQNVILRGIVPGASWFTNHKAEVSEESVLLCEPRMVLTMLRW